MTTTISSPIKSCAVAEKAPKTDAFKPVELDEKLDRPDHLEGKTYKIVTPLADHALYITINDVILNKGTVHESRRPFEIFINSKSMDHYQWVAALTKIMSGVFRKGGDITFLCEELASVFDPRGGYFKKGGGYMNSLVAEIGFTLKQHLMGLNMIDTPQISTHTQAILDEKRAAFESINKASNMPTQETVTEKSSGKYPAGSTPCAKCAEVAVVKTDGCFACLSCGESRCS